jgi:dTDP-4-amino-4,6-dideoxygalactose transaminase
MINKGQYNLPAWEKFESMVDGIFDRKYYTNHGPLLKEVESKLATFFNVKHAVCMTNTDIAKMISLKALDIQGDVLIPSFSHISNSQSAIWASLTPCFYDLENNTSINSIPKETDINEKTSAIIGVCNFGDSDHVNDLIALSKKHKLKLLLNSSDVIGQKNNGIVHGCFGNAEIFSFNEKESIINGGDGACVTTNDDELAARLRNIRSSYGARHAVSIPYTGNGRMSEIQAGLILISLEEFQKNKLSNRKKYDLYLSILDNIEGMSIFKPSKSNSDLNYQKAILLLDEAFSSKRDDILSLLGTPSMDNSFVTFGFDPLTLNELNSASSDLKNRIIDLPIGSLSTVEDITILANSIIEKLN